jgi:hypothetical protein
MREQFVKLLVVILIFSIMYTFLIKFPSNATSFDMGFVAGTFFGQATKIIGVIGLIVYAKKKYSPKQLS